MLIKLTDSAENELQKAGRSLGNFFAKQAEDLEKSVTSHEQQATHHEALANLHKAHADHHQAMHDSLDKAHEMSAHMAKGAAFHTAAAEKHTALHKVHSAEAEKCKAERNTMKTLAAEWGGAAPGPVSSVLKVGNGSLSLSSPAVNPSGNAITDMVQETTVHLAKKTMEMLDNDAEVQQYMRETVMKMVGEAIGNTVVPTRVSAVAPTAPGITAVPRAGQPALPAKPNVPLQFQKLVAVEEDEEIQLRS